MRRDDRRRSPAEEQGRKPDRNRHQAGDRQRMEHTERVLSMQRQRRHIHKNKRNDVDGSDHSMGMCALRQQENSRTHEQRRDRNEKVSGGPRLFPIQRDHQLATARLCPPPRDAVRIRLGRVPSSAECPLRSAPVQDAFVTTGAPNEFGRPGAPGGSRPP
jgi:hypothetical protein